MHPDILLKAWRLLCTARAMAAVYESNRQTCRYVHSTSKGHEAVQLATALQLLPVDFVSPYYRDDAMLLGMGYSPYELMLQLLAKADDPFSAGRSYYAHPNNRLPDKPKMIHQSSATGMQVIPATGIAQGIRYLEDIGSGLLQKGGNGELPVVVCSMGDASVTEGEVSEAFQFAVLRQLPVIYLVQDNNWGISVSAGEARAMNAVEYAAGFKGLQTASFDGSDFEESYAKMGSVIEQVRKHRIPFLVRAVVPLLGHHTSGVRREFYRSAEDLAMHAASDPAPKLRKRLLEAGVEQKTIEQVERETAEAVAHDFERACRAPDPDPATVTAHVFVPTPVTAEKGTRQPAGAGKILMVDAALYAIREIMEECPEAVLYGQDVGLRLGGVFREAATLAERFGEHRVFNTAIQEAYIIGSTVGLSATGVKPIVEVQFGDYLYPGINQLVTEVAKSCYLSAGKFPVQTLIRVPVGAYGGGGPYHSACVETALLSIKGIKVVYPSNAADMKGLMKAAFYDPNPVVMLEHKGLYWSKVPGTEEAKLPEPSGDYVIPLGVAAVVQAAAEDRVEAGESCCIISYGMGIYWARAAAAFFPGQVEIIDLRCLCPIDEGMIFSAAGRHGKCLVITEEQQQNSFAEALAGRISTNCFRLLDAPVMVLGALNLPAVPINIRLEEVMLPGASKVRQAIENLLAY